jgi:eukaryotic-like serine/threonine-protein kinase
MAVVGAADFEGTDRFQVIRRLGAGGMGVVYEARDRERNCRVALKTVRNLGGEDLLRLKNEFRALQDLQHPNLVSLGELLEADGRWFFTMELIEGVSFIDWVRPHGAEAQAPEPPDDPRVSPDAETVRAIPGHPSDDEVATPPTLPAAVSLARAATARPAAAPASPPDEERLRPALAQLALALAAAHAAGKIHRDIKPSNILVTHEGRVVLLDFGLVTGIAPGDQSSTLHAVGTVDYMAPEQTGSQRVGPEADWYAVGVVLYQSLTGRLPFAGAPMEVLYQKHQADPSPPALVCPGVPADLNDLCVDLLRFDPSKRPATPEVLKRLGAAGEDPRASSTSSLPQSAPFVGRRDELRVLAEAYEASRAGAAVAALVEGESGVGKSALVRRFTEKLERRGIVVLAGRCYEREAVPYKAVDGVIDALSRYMSRLPGEEAAALLPRTAGLVGDVFPAMRRVKAVAMAPRLHADARIDPQELRSRLFAAIRELFARLADRRPLVVVVDDIQWADADSIAMISEVLRPPEAPALLFLATLRTGTAHAVPDLLRFLPTDARRIALGRLPADDARELAARLLARATAANAVSPEEIASEAEGHPLFIDELVRHAASREGTGPVALRLDEALRARVAALPGDARRVLEVVALAGTPLPHALIGQAAGVEPDQLARFLGLLRIGNLVQTTGARGADMVAPYHDRVREAVVAQLGDDARRAYYAELAAALEASAQPDPEVLAVLWRGAGDLERAADHSVRAAAAAEAAFAFDRAAQLYRTALDLQPAGAPAARDLLVRLGDALAKAGRGPEAAEIYGRAAVGASPTEALDLRRLAASQLLMSGRVDEALDEIRSLAGATKVRLARSPRAALASLLLRRALVRLRGYSVRLRTPDEIPPEQLRRFDFCWSIAAALGSVDTIRGTDLNARVLLMALRAGEPDRIALALGTEVTFVAMGGRSARGRTAKLLQSLDELRRPRDEGLVRASGAFAHGAADYYLGRFRDAEAHFAEAERTLRDECVGMAWALTSARIFRLWSLCYLGRVADLAALSAQYLTEAVDRGNLYAATSLKIGLNHLGWMVGDDVAEARRLAQEALAGWSRAGTLAHDWFGLTAEAQLDLYEGRGVDAHRRITERWRALARSLILRVQTVRSEAYQLRARAALAAAVEDTADRARLLGEAERDARRIAAERLAWSDPLAELILGGVAAARGDREAAARRCAAAAAGFDAADMALYAAVARCRQGQLGGADGRALIDDAEAWMRGQRIKSPGRWTAMLAPGFPA